MSDRRLELGSWAALARSLGVSVRTARRLTLEGPPPRWTEDRLLQFAQALYTQAHQRQQDRDPVADRTLRQRRQAPVYSETAQRAAAGSLVRALRELEDRRACEPARWSPVVALSDELGVPAARVRRWVTAALVPQAYMDRVTGWAQARADREQTKIAERGRVEALIEEAKRPAFVHTLPGAPRKFAHRAPDLRTGERPTESEERSGYSWDLRVEKWSSFELIESLCAWAASRRRPGPLAAPARAWIVTALCTIYHPHGRQDRKTKSPGARRQFEHRRDRQMGRDLSINVPVSSRTVKRGGLSRAVRLFREALTIEHCEHEQVFVHGLVVRNWRWRTESQRRNYRERLMARLENEARLTERDRVAAQARRRALRKKKSKTAKKTRRRR